MKMRWFIVSAASLGASTMQAQVVPVGTYSPTNGSICFNAPGCNVTTSVMQSTVLGTGVTLTLGAHERFGPGLASNSAGTYYGSTSPGPLATWNFDYAIQGPDVGLYTYGLFWDFDPAAGNANHNGFFFNSSGLADNQNLGFGFLDFNGLGLPNFDPTAQGEYTFQISAYTKFTPTNNCFGNTASCLADVNPNSPTLPGGVLEQGRVAMQVNVVPEPNSSALIALGLGAVATVARRRRSLITA